MQGGHVIFEQALRPNLMNDRKHLVAAEVDKLNAAVKQPEWRP